MKWASASSDSVDFATATSEVLEQLRSELGRREPDLLVVFVSAHHAENYEQIPRVFRRVYPKSTLVGCTGGGIIGGGRELEHQPALSVTAAMLPGVELYPSLLDSRTMATVAASPYFIRNAIDLPEDSQPDFLLLPDPYSIDTERLLVALDTVWPKSTSLGGLASGGHEPGDHALFLDDQVHREGCVVLAMSGNIRIDTIVAQGCRPVGEPMRVTNCRGNFVVELDDRKPAEVLRGVYESASAVDRHLIQTSLFLGVALDEEAPGTGEKDFLIRNVLGVDPEAGVLAVGTLLTKHQRVQFHVRDQKTSRHDLGSLLAARSRQDADGEGPCGALLFSCLGRGARLYGEPGHDSRLFTEHLGPIPLGGFFCNGEIGPVQGRAFVHGYTSVFGLFRPRD